MVQQSELPYHSDQLIVDLQHFPVVEKQLNDLGVTSEQDGKPSSLLVDTDPLLGLVRIKNLRDAASAAIDVDSLLALLRQRIGAERDGWVPTMGKNRWVHDVLATGTKPMGYEEPTPPRRSDHFRLPDPQSTKIGLGVRIGLIDTPLEDPVPGMDGTLPMRAGHGRFVRSLILKQAPAATIVPVGALDPITGRADSWRIAQAMMQVGADEPVDILNLSLGCYAPGGPPLVISRAIERLTPHVLVVAAAGNHGTFEHWKNNRTSRSANWLAAVYPTIAVGAVNGLRKADDVNQVDDDDAMDGDGPLAEFNPNLHWLTCTAPGVEILGAYLEGKVELSEKGLTEFSGQARWSGTSFAAATVSGAVAARMVAGSRRLSAREAFAELLEDTGQNLVRKFAIAP